MITSEFNNIHIGGLCCALPTRYVENVEEYTTVFGLDVVKKNEATTGIMGSYLCHEKQTASDLCFAAAEKLLNEKQIDRSTIGVLLYCSYSRDFIAPATAYVLQYRLGLPEDCIVMDVPVGCSGFVCGLHTMSSLLFCSTAKRGLLLVGDTTRRNISPLDKSVMLFGDAGSAILVEKRNEQPALRFAIRSDGGRYSTIFMPDAGERVLEQGHHERTLREDGNVRSDYDMQIRGMDIFNFSITDVPRLILEFMAQYDETSDHYDYLLLHQANLFIMKHLAKKVNFPMAKVPVSIGRYGNCGGVTIPVTICDAFVGAKDRHIHALMSGFGVGLSWAVATIDFDTRDVLPIFYTDDFYTQPQ